MFCAAHAYAMACDSLYCAWLKAHYPFEFYSTILKLYTEKGNKDKIALILDEMYRYKHIRLKVGKFGEDNRDWFYNKENNTISQSLRSVKFMSPQVASDLYEAGKLELYTFTDCLWHLLTETCLDTRHIGILIRLGYFEKFGGSKKLLEVFNEFYTGKFKLSKKVKSWQERLEANRANENFIKDEELPIEERLKAENECVGLCFSSDPDKTGMYFVLSIDNKYGVKVKLYNIFRGTATPELRMKKDLFARNPLEENTVIKMKPQDIKQKQRFSYKDGKRTALPGVFDWWIDNYQKIS